MGFSSIFQPNNSKPKARTLVCWLSRKHKSYPDKQTGWVFISQVGLALYSAGNIRSKNVMNIFLKNIIDCCFTAPVFFLFGWGFAFGNGKDTGGFIGNDNFALSDLVSNPARFLNVSLFLVCSLFADPAAELCFLRRHPGGNVYNTLFPGAHAQNSRYCFCHNPTIPARNRTTPKHVGDPVNTVPTSPLCLPRAKYLGYIHTCWYGIRTLHVL